MKDNHYYCTINEFSQLSGVPKERLRFYDKEGLFSPAKIAQNGYRYYDLTQLYQLLLIILLTKLDSYSHSDIRQLFDDPQMTFATILAAQIPLLEEKKIEMQCRMDAIRNCLQINKRLDFYTPNESHILYISTQKKIVTSAFKAKPFSKTALEMLEHHIKTCTQNSHVLSIPVNMMIDSTDFQNRQYLLSAYYSDVYSTHPSREPKEATVPMLYYHTTSYIKELTNILDQLHGEIQRLGFHATDQIQISIITSDLKKTTNGLNRIQIIIPLTPGCIPSNEKQERENYFENDTNFFFSTGRFASCCGITKETLRFYNRQKLLVPCKVTSNGYQYYSCEQIAHYYMIRMLQRSGCTLEEINQYLNDSSYSFDKILQIGLTRYERKYRILTHYLEQSKAIIQTRSLLAAAEHQNQPFLWNFYVLPFRETFSSVKMSMNSKESLKNLTEHIECFFRPESLIYLPIASIMAPEDFLNQNLQFIGHSSFFHEDYSCLSDLHEQTYLTLISESNSSSLIDNLNRLRKLVQEKHYEITGNIQIIFSSDSLFQSTANSYLVYLLVPIK